MVGLLALLDPDVVMREDFGDKRPVRVERGAAVIAGRARSIPGATVLPVVVNGAPGGVVVLRERPFALIGFTVRHGRIVEIDAIFGAQRVRRIAAAVLE
jgi:RNA polymerase sigma-70 factor (ECF subfamily)